MRSTPASTNQNKAKPLLERPQRLPPPRYSEEKCRGGNNNRRPTRNSNLFATTLNDPWNSHSCSWVDPLCRSIMPCAVQVAKFQRSSTTKRKLNPSRSQLLSRRWSKTNFCAVATCSCSSVNESMIYGRGVPTERPPGEDQPCKTWVIFEKLPKPNK